MINNRFAYNNFNNNIKSCEDLIKLHNVVTEKLPILQEEADDILRAALVLSVSALDTFLHDFYRTEIVESYADNSRFNVNFDRINISISLLKNINASRSDAEKKNLLDSELRQIQKEDSYQSNKSIEYIFTNLGIKGIWSELEKIGVKNLKAKEIKQELASIVDRRNKIAHESDWDYINYKKYPIQKADIESVIGFIKELAKAFGKIMVIA